MLVDGVVLAEAHPVPREERCAPFASRDTTADILTDTDGSFHVFHSKNNDTQSFLPRV
jgi:hypothetical protein